MSDEPTGYSKTVTVLLIVGLVFTAPLGIFIFTAPFWWFTALYVAKRIWKGHRRADAAAP